MGFVIDTGASRFTVQAFATGILSAFGHNPVIGIRDFEGKIEFAPESLDKARVQVTVRTSVMEVLNQMKTDDLKKLKQEMYEKVLEIQRYPLAAFKSKVIIIQKASDDLFRANVSGELSFHGVKRDHSFDARVVKIGDGLRISGEFPLRQSEYGIKPFSFAGGILRLKDELQFKFELLARKQD